MQIRMQRNGITYQADLSARADLSIPVSAQGITAWGLPRARLEPHRTPDFTGSVASGASVNFRDISFNPHAHGTHTECLGHITEALHSVNETPPFPWLFARLLTVTPELLKPVQRITREQLQQGLGTPGCDAVILRTLPNAPGKRDRSWSGSNPPCLSPEAAGWLAGEGVEHLLIDLPSVDPEEDGGALAAHRAFWGLSHTPRTGATITELIYVPDHVADGVYLLNLQMGPFDNDACPSRPLVFKLNPI